MSEFQKLQEDWGRELQEKGDISQPIHKTYLGRLQKILRENPETTDIADSAFYIQMEAGFYRFRILEVLDSQEIRYQVNFHVFPASQTHIHSHGYEWYSHVLAGELNYSNFLPEIFSDQQQEVFERLFAFAFTGRSNPERLKKQISGELWDVFLWKSRNVTFNAEVFAAFIGGGDDEDFGFFTPPNEISNILQDSVGRFHRLIPQNSGTVSHGKSYAVWKQEAHVIEVPEYATSLFLTKQAKNTEFSGWEFQYFPEIISSKSSRIQGIQSPREVLMRRLLGLKI